MRSTTSSLGRPRRQELDLRSRYRNRAPRKTPRPGPSGIRGPGAALMLAPSEDMSSGRGRTSGRERSICSGRSLAVSLRAMRRI